jgi:hypothetical protein
MSFDTCFDLTALAPSAGSDPPRSQDRVHVDSRPTLPPPRRSSGVVRKAYPQRALDPLEEALLSRPLWDSREPEPAVHEILYRFALGDEAGAVAAADLLLDGRRAPALTVSLDVLDELNIDHRAALILSYMDDVTPLSRVLAECGLDRADAIRTMCELVERRIVVLRALPAAGAAAR